MKNTFRKPNQHFVPCFYLGFFAYSEGVRKPHLYVYDKKNVKFFSDATKNLGWPIIGRAKAKAMAEMVGACELIYGDQKWIQV